MANKLKKTFSNKPVERNVCFTFSDIEKYKALQESLSTVWDKGEVVTIDCEGTAQVKTSINNDEKSYPITMPQETLTHIVVGPAKESFVININKGDKLVPITCYRQFQKNKTIVEIPCGSALLIKIEFLLDEKKSKVYYNQHHTKSSNIKEIFESFENGFSFLEFFYNKDLLKESHQNPTTGSILIKEWKNDFNNMATLYKKLYEIEKKFELAFKPKNIVISNEFFEDIEELYELILCKNIIKYRNTFKDFKTSEMNIMKEGNDFTVGNEILLTFCNKQEYDLIDTKITINLACALLNAKIKEIKYTDTEIESIIFEGTDSNPITMSYSGFKTEEEANAELKQITEKIEEYKSANILSRYFPKDKN